MLCHICQRPSRGFGYKLRNIGPFKFCSMECQSIFSDNNKMKPNENMPEAALYALGELYEYSPNLRTLSQEQAQEAANIFAQSYHSKLVELARGKNKPSK